MRIPIRRQGTLAGHPEPDAPRRIRFCRLRRSALVALFCLMICGLTPRPGHAASSAPMLSDPRFGVVEAWRAPDQAGAIGVRWERLSFWWREMQPDGPDSWNSFAVGHDRFIDSELVAGRSLVGLLINTPDWAASHILEHGSSVPKGLYLSYDSPRNYWGHFVGLIARHYAGRIDDWIIWNEVTIHTGHWHTWSGSTADYAQLVKVAYLAARAANPRARIILAGDPYWYDHGSSFGTLMRLLTAGAGLAHRGYFDVANLHLYSRPKDLLTIVPLYRQVMARYGLHKPIWIAETNAIPYNDPARQYPRSGFFASLADQASYIVEAYALDLALGVSRIEVNRMTDGTDFKAGGEPFGLIRNDGSIRPAYYAFRTVSRLFSQVSGGTVHVDPATDVYTVTLRKGGETLSVIWDQGAVPAAATISAQSPEALVYVKMGVAHPVRAVDRRYTMHLPPATGNTDPADPHDYVMGGSPSILVQPA